MPAIFYRDHFLCNIHAMEQIPEINALIRFYLEAGVDETIGTEPVDRFKPVATAAAAPEKPLSRPQNKPQKASQAVPTVNLTDGIRSAVQSAAQCKTIDQLLDAINEFEGCSLKKMATNTVFASGNPNSRLMVIDRPPSVDEDRSGLPFSGSTGALLEKMLAAIGLEINEVYRTSILPWRPPGGRTPTDEELALCLPFIERHIALAKPQFILLCGEAAAYLHRRKSGINKLRGHWTDFQYTDGTSATLAIFHPAFLLDHPSSKKYAWVDLQSLKAAMERIK
ncbi:uracil-DNA glycosylase [Sneathiella marina]|uniref:Type-4 uracil-DNA glycosylase n=1 Tax=Sneathiella marina TaxID=2950108 RepID=A0ABY4WC23_9PROT|nr:uracil-DNA glycosylase [Sneathiella marina]USG62201.1 uracil-DNA glycosylase [Sneathiella marina]